MPEKCPVDVSAERMFYVMPEDNQKNKQTRCLSSTNTCRPRDTECCHWHMKQNLKILLMLNGLQLFSSILTTWCFQTVRPLQFTQVWQCAGRQVIPSGHRISLPYRGWPHCIHRFCTESSTNLNSKLWRSGGAKITPVFLFCSLQSWRLVWKIKAEVFVKFIWFSAHSKGYSFSFRSFSTSYVG